MIYKKVFILFLCIVSTHIYSSDDISIEGFGIRAVPAVSKVSAAFGIIKNMTSRHRKLVNVQTDISEFVELHTHKKKRIGSRKVFKMRKVDFIKIPKNGERELKRLSYHIMLINLKRALKVGQKIKMKFIFDDGTEIQELIPVKKY